jgi:two-component system chemotaxis sensor kinase CheA
VIQRGSASVAAGARVEMEPAPLPELPDDGEVPQEILECFLLETEEHLQSITECLLGLEGTANPEEINLLFREMHTVKGSAAQVGMHRIAHVAHRAEDLLGRLRDGELLPSDEIVDISLEVVDVLKKFLYHEWTEEEGMRATVGSLLTRIARLAPPEPSEEESMDGVDASESPEVEASLSGAAAAFAL